ncbi:run domain Beclin-1-interacting and cysteine-rich domain-containing protein-like isoform X10 [Clavelina lepadiformis]|uniref:run domain Beclin-1-interacting and cysteine-rich domain-containing protein-like isoform X10 n=1 Tax=Clavelina lepadiformis TaxID=159417 RepID=UPI0040432314
MENVGKQSPHRFEEKLTCFNEFKSVVERIVSQRSCIIWSVHGGLTSVITAADLIFKHGNKSHTGVLGPVVDYWLFVRGLRWLEPTLAPDIDYLSKLPAASPGKPQFNKVKPISRPRVHFTHGQQWLEKSFKDQSLSRQFKVLLSNKSHLSEHYHDWAYLSDNTFASATLVCIRALEQNSSTLLARIPTPLLGRRRTTKQNSNPRLHRAVTLPQVKVAQKFTHRRSKSEQIKGVKVIDEADNNLANCDDLNEVANVRIKPSSSLPSLNESPDVCYNDIVPTKAQPKSQSLMSYLRNQDLATCADIDKENAHFDFSDMLIGAIEQMKCKMRDHQTLNKTAGSSMLASRTSTPSLRLPVDETGSSYSHLGDGLMTPRSQFSISESYQSPVGSFLSDPYPQHLAFSAADLPLRTDQTFKSGVDFCDAESTITTMTGRKSVAESFRTAESIAIGLLQTFSDQRHVTEREVDWLISEDDVPQKLLPLPRSTAVDPDQGLDAGIRIRGNQTWAPPRPQIILKAPIKLKVKQAMIKQNFLCAGCGSRVEKSQSSSSEDIFRFFSDLSALILTVTPVRNIIMFSCYTDYMKRFRYCEYTGKYFCTCCHDNKLFIIPAYILHKFDFNKYKVCNFSYDWLNKINCEPLFNINDVNPGLYRKSKVMASIKGLRVQLLSLYKYLQTCHFAKADDNSGNLFEEVQSHFLPHFFEEDPHIYSLDDFMSLKSGQLLDDLKKTVDLASEHVVSCQSCRMKGFICEFCGCEEIIFPHQPSTSTCPLCNACFHKKCYVSSACPRCTRLVKRKQMLQKISEE